MLMVSFRLVATFLVLLPVLSPRPATAKSNASTAGCVALVFAEYCFPGGAFEGLIPVDDILEMGQERARVFLAERKEPSDVSPKRQAELNIMWHEAIAEAFIYADRHSMKLSGLGPPKVDLTKDASPLSRLADALSSGPLFRLSFAQTPRAAFSYNGTLHLHRQRSLRLLQTLLPRAGLIALGLSVAVNALPRDGEYVDLDPVLRLPHLRRILETFQGGAGPSNKSLRGFFGIEMILGLYLAIEDSIRLRSNELGHRVHFYKDGSHTSHDMDAPQVLWTGDLLLSDEAIKAFSDGELELLMRHEAMHLMRPNFFMTLSAADLTQRAFFPDLNTEHSSSMVNNLLGRASPGKPINCPLELSEDDELWTDYYVFHLFREKPEKQLAYNDLLKRIHQEFSPGAYSQAAFRVELGNSLIAHFGNDAEQGADPQLETALYWKSIMSAIWPHVLNSQADQPPTINSVLDEMEKHPEIANDARLLRIMINYYKRRAMVPDGWGALSSRSTLSCVQIGSMFSTYGPKP